MNKWISPHIQEDIAEIEKNRQKNKIIEAQQNQTKKPVNYVILDAALWNTDTSTAFRLCPVYTSLFATRGAERELDDVAPYLFPYLKDTDFSKWLIEKEKKGLRALYISSDETLEGLRKHLRRFLRVKTEKGKWLFFRFYDPHVASITLPHLNEEQQFYFYFKINYIQLYHRLTKESNIFFPSIEATRKIQENSIQSYPTLIIDNNQFETINQARKEEYVNRVILQLYKDRPQYQDATNDSDKISEFVREQIEQIDQGTKFGFASEKNCYEYICLMADCWGIESCSLSKQQLAILNNQQYSNSKKISNIRNLLQKQE